MLEHVPHWLGALLRDVRAGDAKLAIVQPELGVGDAKIDLSSTAFGDGARLPERFTADGEGVSPPLLWSEPPEGAASLALIVEDPDAPAPNPLVHAILWGLAADQRGLAEGAIAGEGGAEGEIGRNSYFAQGWLPPDPPTGHGAHRYVFQLFALSEAITLDARPGRADLVAAMAGKVLASGVLIGVYSRGEEAATGGAQGVGARA